MILEGRLRQRRFQPGCYGDGRQWSAAMKRQLILYAGLHKTATTSIQETCAANLRKLRKAGLVYPMMTREGQQESNHTTPLTWAFREAPHRAGLSKQFVAGDDAALASAI